MSDVVREMRMAARRLRQSPGFTSVAVLTLALGIAATSAIFTVVDAVVLRPLPYRSRRSARADHRRSAEARRVRHRPVGLGAVRLPRSHRPVRRRHGRSGRSPRTSPGRPDPERVETVLAGADLLPDCLARGRNWAGCSARRTTTPASRHGRRDQRRPVAARLRRRPSRDRTKAATSTTTPTRSSASRRRLSAIPA